MNLFMASNFLEQWKKTGRKINHSGFDVSGIRIWGTPAGLQNVPFNMETNPNEHFEIDIQGYMRTETMNTAAFVDGKVITSIFFVPYSQIWHNFNSFVTQKDDRHSSAYKDKVFVPTISLGKLFQVVNNMYATYQYIYLTDLLEGTYDVNKFPAKSLSYYATKFSTAGDSVGIKLQYIEDMHGIPYIFNLLRSIQYFKFGNPYEVVGIYDEYIQEVLADESHDDDDIKNALVGAYNAFQIKYYNPGPLKDKHVNIFRPAAYQHIFYDFYRNKFFDETPYFQPNNGDDMVRYIDVFNFDDIVCDSLASSDVAIPSNTTLNMSDESIPATWARFLNLFDLHYRQYKHDIYTSAMLSTQFGVVSGVSFEGTPDITLTSTGDFRILGVGENVGGKIIAYNRQSKRFITSVSSTNDDAFVGLNSDPITGDVTLSDFETGSFVDGIDSSDDTISGVSYSAVPADLKFNIPSLFNVLQLRRAELLQQWKQNALRAGNMVDDNFKAHYGVEPYYESTNNVNLIGSWECQLEAKPITATAATGEGINGKVGDLAALGVGSAKGHKVRFKTNDFGVIMAVSYFLPDVVYSANGIDAQNTLVEPFDFYSEEFENIGFENLPFWRQSIGFGQSMDNNFGFVPPYTMYKTNVDECFDEFCQIGKFSGSMRAWTIQRADIPAYQVGDVAVRSRSAFYVDPRVTDALFAVNYDGSSKTNPIACYFNFDFKALRPMSVLGLPIFS